MRVVERIKMDKQQSSHKAVRLERLRLKVSLLLSRTFTNDVLMSVYEDSLADKVMISFETQVAAETIESITVKYPANWKEAVKERFLPEFLRKRFPIQYTVQTVKIKVLYPKISLPKLDHVVKIYENKYGEKN
jgi:hypothetical protein